MNKVLILAAIIMMVDTFRADTRNDKKICWHYLGMNCTNKNLRLACMKTNRLLMICQRKCMGNKDCKNKCKKKKYDR